MLDFASKLVLPQIKQRQLTGLQFSVIRKMELTLGYKLSSRTSTSQLYKHPPKSSVRERFGLSCTEASGPGQKKRKNGMNLFKSQGQSCAKRCVQAISQVFV